MKPNPCPDINNGNHNCRFYLLLISLCLIVLGSKFWLIHQAGSDLPDWDQWNGEGGNLLMPYFHGNLSFWDLFKPHNEHRIFFHRLLCLGTVLLNHQWDARLEMVASAIIHTLAAVTLFWIMVRLVPSMIGWFFLIISIAFSLPFSWENTLSGFQSQFYFMLLFSISAMALLVLSKPFTWKWFSGLLLAFLCIFTMASGVLAACAVFAFMLVKLLKDRRNWRLIAGVGLGCLVIIGIGLLLNVSVPDHASLRAQSITEFIHTLGKNLAWPNVNLPWLAIVNFIPLIMLGLFYLRSREQNLKAEEITLTLGIWGIMQAVAISYARSATGPSLHWRYMDLLSICMIVNGLSISILIRRYIKTPVLSRCASVVFAIWAIACGLGLYSLSALALRVDIPRHKFLADKRIENARAFVATDDIRTLESKPHKELPYPDPQYLAFVLRDSAIRQILPASVRPALQVNQQNVTNHTFIPNGLPPEFPAPRPGETCWGSFSLEGIHAEGIFESLPIRRSSLPVLKFELAGNLGERYLAMKLTGLEQQKAINIQPAGPSLSDWQPFYIKSPRGEFRIFTHDAHCRRWFAFKQPKEMGYYSYLADRVTARGRQLLLIGITAAAFIFLLGYFKNIAYDTHS